MRILKANAETYAKDFKDVEGKVKERKTTPTTGPSK